MFHAIAFGLAVAAGVQAWRAFPPASPATVDGLALVFVVGLVCAYFAGRRRRGSSASATAVASAEATAEATASNVNTVNLIVTGERVAGSSSVRMPSEAAPWMVGAVQRLELDADDLDGLDVAELLDRDTELEER